MTHFKCLLEVSIRVQHKFIAWHQRQHIKNRNNFKCDTCSSSKVDKNQKIVPFDRATNTNAVHRTLLSNLSTLSRRFINIVKRRKGLTKLDVSNIAILLLSFYRPGSTAIEIDDLFALSTCIFKFYDATKKFNAELTNCTITRDDQVRTMRHLFNIEIPLNSTISSAIFKLLLAEKFLPDLCISLAVRRIYNLNELLANLLDDRTKDALFESILSEHVKSLICLTSHNCVAVLHVDDDYRYSVFCDACIDGHLNETESKVLIPTQFVENDALSDYYMNNILRLIQSNQLLVRLNIVQCLPAICFRHSHVLCSTENLYWTNVFNDKELAFEFKFLQIIPRIIDAINVMSTNFFDFLCVNFQREISFLIAGFQSGPKGQRPYHPIVHGENTSSYCKITRKRR